MSTKSRSAKLRRVQELFTEGRPITLGEGENVVRLWVAKPSAFEREEAVMDGRSARARKVLAFDRDSDEQDLVEAKLAETSREDLVNALVGAKANDFYLQATDELRARKDWEERFLALDRSAALIDDLARASGDDDEDARSRVAEEREAMGRLQGEFLRAVSEATQKLAEDYERELSDADTDRLHKEYREAYRERAGTQAFLEEKRITELYFAVRDCESEDGEDHSKCNGHVQRLAEHRHEVHQFPDRLIVAARDALEALQMSPEDAAFSDALTPSSASSGQPGVQEESTASTPTETSPAPVGT